MAALDQMRDCVLGDRHAADANERTGDTRWTATQKDDRDASVDER